MKNKLLTLAGALSLLAVLGHFYAKPLLAQVRAALVKNIDEQGRNPYHATVTCPNGGVNEGCSALFPAVPTGKRAVIEYVNVEIGGSTASAAILSSSDGSAVLPVFATGLSSFGVSQRLLLYAEAGEQPNIQIFGNNTVFLANISGYLVDLTQ